MEMSLLLVIVGGIVVLVVLALGVGAGLDTEAQRRAWRRVADERRHLHSEQLTAYRAPLCERCPYRRPTDR